MRFVGLSLGLAAWALLLAVGSAAHEGEGPSLDAEKQQLRAGEDVLVAGDDFEVGEEVALELWSLGDVYPLGAAEVDSEGHFAARVTVPAGVEDGYAEIQATSNSGASAALVVLVGAGPDLSEGLPGPPAAPSVGTDPAAILLFVFIGAGVLAVLFAAFRRGEATRRRR